jgi:hypothetical protein
MAVNRVDTNKVSGAKGGNVVRPLYGVFIRDQVAQYRGMLAVTLQDLKAGIKAGNPKASPIMGDGILQGSELTKAKKAAKEVNDAIKALKPVFGGPASGVNSQAARNALGRSGPPGQFVALYGVVLADDLRQYRTSIRNDIDTIKTGIKSGELKGKAKTEATKAVKELQQALKALGNVPF